jgi:hypothetical protein
VPKSGLFSGSVREEENVWRGGIRGGSALCGEPCHSVEYFPSLMNSQYFERDFDFLYLNQTMFDYLERELLDKSVRAYTVDFRFGSCCLCLVTGLAL